jgi:hypothetical protein
MAHETRFLRGQNIGRREFIATVSAAGGCLAIAGILPVSLKAADQGQRVMTKTLAFDAEFRLGDLVPTVARCEMLEVRSINFMATKGYVRVDVGFRFVDGRLDGGAAFRMRLLDENGAVVAEQTSVEMRDRQMIVQRRYSLPSVEGERPNRPGSVEFRFREVLPTAQISRFSLEIWPVE